MSAEPVTPTPIEPAAPVTPVVADPSVVTPSALSTPTPEAAAPVTPGSWRDSLSADLQGNPTLAGINSVEDLAKEHVNVQRIIGVDKMPRPQEGWTEEQWGEHHTRMGRPADVKDYDLSKLEVQEGYPVDEGFQGAMVEAMHKRGASQEMVAGVLQDYYNLTGEQLSAQGVDIQQTTENRIGDLRKEWGKSYDAQVDLAKRAIMAGAGESYQELGNIQLKDGTLLGDHPSVIKTFAALGGKMSEHGLVGATASRASRSPAEARNDIANLKADQNFLNALTNNQNPEHAMAVDKWSRLHEAAEEDTATAG